ncbi:MAG: peptidoglycan DD-metalloendopeptidase family protein [Alphaproteobacteria bacterium]|nr:peptidoglycan DD-metalloendopeptidase family protein [Alphaproteobacteria bacterium]
MRRLALLALCVPILMGAAKHPETRCALAKYFDAHATECGKPKVQSKARTEAQAKAKGAKKPKVAAARPAAAKPEPPPLNDNTDTSHAIPARDAVKLPSTTQQFDALRNQIVHDRPAVADAKQKSDALKAQAAELQKKLVATAARVLALESEKVRLDADIARLTAEDRTLAAGFARDRVSVARLLAMLERMQHDMPPAIVLRPDDALGAARSAMLIGASVPGVYSQAAALSRRIKVLKDTRAKLVARRAEGVRNASRLRTARAELDQLLASKELEADAATSRYGDLAARLEKAATTAADLKTLLEKVASLRNRPDQRDIVVVAAQRQGGGPLQGRSLLLPVVGRQVAGGMEGVGGGRAPGLTFATQPAARVVAPADSEVIFAGPYHKTGQVLILEITAGYDLVLAGLGRVDVRPNDEVLAGEPVGTMPGSGQDVRLYFELRQNGHGTSPAPWLSVELRKAQKS